MVKWSAPRLGDLEVHGSNPALSILFQLSYKEEEFNLANYITPANQVEIDRPELKRPGECTRVYMRARASIAMQLNWLSG